MRHLLACVVLAAALAPLPARAQSYAQSATPFNWIPTAGHTVLTAWDGSLGCPGAAGDDSLSVPLAIGFPFPFGPAVYTQLRIAVNGRLQFANAYCSFGTQSVGPPRTYPDPMPDADMNRTIRVYGADLDVSPRGSITYATVGAAPNRTFVVSWNDVPQWDTGPRTAYNLQIQLFENGDFALMYGDYDDVNTGTTPIGPAQRGWQLTTTDFFAVSGLPARNSGFLYRWARARPSIAKASVVLSDPVGGTTNPKRIPGAVVRYDVTVRNTGPGAADANTVVLTDPIPANTDLCVAAACGGSPVVEFVNGSPSSGLALAPANVTYSSQPSGGPPYTYVPAANAEGYDPAVRGLRIAPTGTFAAAAGASQPNFTVRFRVRVR